MRHMQWIKAGLLTSAILGLAAPALAQPDGPRDNSGRREARPDGGGRPDRGGGDRGGGFQRGGERGGDRAERPNGWNSPNRAAPVVGQAPASRPMPEARPSRGYAGRPGTDEAPRAGPGPVTRPVQTVQQPSRPNWSDDRSRTDDRRDRDRDGRDWDDRRPRDGQNWTDRDRNDRDRDRPNWNNNNDNNWNDRDRRDWNDRRDRNDNRWDNRWRYEPGRRYNDRDRWSDFRRWDNNQWRRDQRYNWEYWRRSHRDVYRLPRYVAPHGWTRGYSRFSIGIRINSFFFSSTYWIDDPYRYRLPPAYGALRWVRYYDDALLIDIRDGYVVDVVHGVFW